MHGKKDIPIWKSYHQRSKEKELYMEQYQKKGQNSIFLQKVSNISKQKKLNYNQQCHDQAYKFIHDWRNQNYNLQLCCQCSICNALHSFLRFFMNFSDLQLFRGQYINKRFASLRFCVYTNPNPCSGTMLMFSVL